MNHNQQNRTKQQNIVLNPLRFSQRSGQLSNVKKPALAGIALAVVLASSVSFAANSYAPVALRGTDGGSVSISHAHKAPEELLRGAVLDDDSIDPFVTTSIGSDIAEAGRFLRDNIVPVLLFRGAQDPIADRHVTYTVPDRAPLRDSLLHSTDFYNGLRGPTTSVGETVADTLRGSYAARRRLARTKADRARVYGALGAFLPRLEGTMDATYGTQSSSSSSNDELNKRVEVGLQLTMPLYTSGVNLNTYRRAKHLSHASDYTYLAEEQRVALEAIAAHINLRLNRRIESTLGANVAAVRKIEAIARRLFKAGEASKTDIAIAEANVESAKSERDIARRTREETQVDYESLTARVAPGKLKSGDYESMLPNSLAEAVELAVNNNPSLAASIHTEQAARHAARAERGRYGPQVNLVGSYSRELYSSEALSTSSSDNDEDWSIGVRLRVPIFDATTAPNVMAARYEAIEEGYRSLDEARDLKRRAEQQWTRYQSAKRRSEIVRRQVSAIAKSLTGAQREYQAGFRSITDVLNAQVRLARAKIQLETVRHERMLAAYELAITTFHPGVRHLASRH